MDDDGMVFRVSPALLTDDEKVNTKLPPDSPNPANTPETSSKSNSSGSTKKRGRSRAPTKRRASTSGRKRRGGSTNKRAAKRTYKRKNGTSGEKERTCPHHKPDENKKEESKQPGTGGDGSSTTPTGTTPNQQQPPRNFKDKLGSILSKIDELSGGRGLSILLTFLSLSYQASSSSESSYRNFVSDLIFFLTTEILHYSFKENMKKDV